MNKKSFTLLIIATIFTFITMYLPQPLQPYFAEHYQRTIAQAGALTTMIMLPLAIAPILYGYILGKIHPSALLKFALFALALSNLAFPFLHSFNLLLLMRFIQGALIPIILTAIISLLTHDNPRSEATLSLYVSATIIGGFLGRFLTGLFDTYTSWHHAYYLSALILLTTASLTPNPPQQSTQTYKRPALTDFIAIVQNRRLLTLLLIIFSTMFSYISLLNYLPFLLLETLSDAGSLLTGLMYSGNIIGVIISLTSRRIVTRFGIRRSLYIAMALSLLSQAIIFSANLYLIFIVLLTYSGGVFLIHSILIGMVNRHSPFAKSLTNAFYISFYYAGAVLGSYLPGLLFDHYGRHLFLSSLILVTASALIALITLPQQRHAQ